MVQEEARMNEISKPARQSAAVAGVTAMLYLLVVLFKPAPHFHSDEGLDILGHDDHIHVVYRAVYELDPADIESVTAYFPDKQAVVRIEGGRAMTGRINSGCGEVREWATRYPETYREWELPERDARELRNLYSKITPDFRITSPPEGETYGLHSPDGCMLIEASGERIFLQFGRESAQGYSRYLRVNGGEHLFIVSRYFYTTLEEMAG